MKQLMLYMRQLNQRRTSAFYLLPQSFNGDIPSPREQLQLQHMPMPEDRPRSLRDMFADVEYDSDEDSA